MDGLLIRVALFRTHREGAGTNENKFHADAAAEINGHVLLEFGRPGRRWLTARRSRLAMCRSPGEWRSSRRTK